MFEYENLTVSKLSLVLKTGCYSQREFMFTFQKYFFLEPKRILCMCVLQKEKKLSRAAAAPHPLASFVLCDTEPRHTLLRSHIFG